MILAALHLGLFGLYPTTGAAETGESRLDTQSPVEAPAQSENWAIHGQSTYSVQYHPAFYAPYSGEQSLRRCNCGKETFDLTLYAGLRLWRGAEIWLNPEVNQGFGLSGTHGVAGFPSAESYKAGSSEPYVRWQRLFVRQTINLGGATQTVESDLNVLGGTQSANRVVITIGKFAAPDIFDTNKYAHDGRRDFLNWSLIDAGSWDYAADAWGYSYGIAGEWYQDWWTIRGGVFDLTTVPGALYLDNKLFSQFQWNLELEERHEVLGQPGKLKLTGFLTRGQLGLYEDAIALGQSTDTTPDVNAVIRYRSRAGISLNLEQQLAKDLGLFLRVGMADGSSQIDAFTDIDQTISGGLSLIGARWGRPQDTVGIGVARNGISQHFKNYLNAGGLGMLIGDGKLPHPGMETIVETYYRLAVLRYAQITADYQYIDNPAYNRDRGPVSVFALRLHAQF